MLPIDEGMNYYDGSYQVVLIGEARLRWGCEVIESGLLVYRRTDMASRLEARDTASDWIQEQRAMETAAELKSA